MQLPGFPFISLNVLQIKAASSQVKASPDSLLYTTGLSTLVYSHLPAPPCHCGLGGCGPAAAAAACPSAAGRGPWGTGILCASSANQKPNQTPPAKPSKCKASKSPASMVSVPKPRVGTVHMPQQTRFWCVRVCARLCARAHTCTHIPSSSSLILCNCSPGKFCSVHKT